MSRSATGTVTGMGTGTDTASSSLTDVLDQLQEAYRLGSGRLPQEHLDGLGAMLERAGSRRSLSADHTVVGVFGPTGSGKSSLVNALSGTAAARVAARRPTTSEPLALVWGSAGSEALLDWLEVRQRVVLPDGAPLVAGASAAGDVSDIAHRSGADGPTGFRSGAVDASGIGSRLRGLVTRLRPGARTRSTGATAGAPVPGATGAPLSTPGSGSGGPSTAGLILLDLPDFDSTTEAHLRIVERLTQQVDVLLWVVDPQKYADAALHHGFLRTLTSYGAVTLVALNQADRLGPEDLDAVTSSLAGILADEGLPDVVVLPVSACTGQGVPELAEAIRALAEGRAAAARRIAADAGRAADALLPFAATEHVAPPSDAARAALAEGLGAAAGVPAVVDAVRGAYRRDAHASTGWPVTRWLAALRPDPLRRLNLRSQDLDPGLRRSSLPAARPAQQAGVDRALRVLGDTTARGVAEPWHSSIRDAARETSGELTDALDTAITGTDLETGRSWWWGIFGVLQWIAFAALAAGLVWLGILAGLAFLQLPVLEVPRVEGFPVPTLLITGGVVMGILLAVLAAVVGRWGAARRATRVRHRLLASCARVAHDVVLTPVTTEVERCNEFRTAVHAASRRS